MTANCASSLCSCSRAARRSLGSTELAAGLLAPGLEGLEPCGAPTTEIVPPASPRFSLVQTFLGFGFVGFDAGAWVGLGEGFCACEEGAGSCQRSAAPARTGETRSKLAASVRIITTPTEEGLDSPR